jgi:predicted nucleic-acid-binding Zn-ribbon protein
MEVRLLACPKCGGTLFEVYHATIKNFFYDKSSLEFELHRCKNCGWETHPRDERQIRFLLTNILSGRRLKEGFVFAYEVKPKKKQA